MAWIKTITAIANDEIHLDGNGSLHFNNVGSGGAVDVSLDCAINAKAAKELSEIFAEISAILKWQTDSAN